MIDYQHDDQPQSLETYMLESGSNRFGSLDFQASLNQYVPRLGDTDVQVLEANIQLLPSQRRLPRAAGLTLVHGTPIGGAKPKIATAREIIKLSTSDTGMSIRRKAFATLLATWMSVEAAKVRLTSLSGRDASVVQRFDRDAAGGRIPVLSLLILSGELGLTACYTSYRQLYSQLVQHDNGIGDGAGGVSNASGFGNSVGEEIFRHIIANITLGNSDDHTRNHAVFWDGVHMRLTPAFDAGPVHDASWDSNQAISFSVDGQRESRLDALIVVSCCYELFKADGQHIMEQILVAVRDAFTKMFDETESSPELTAEMFHPSIWENHPLPSSTTDS